MSLSWNRCRPILVKIAVCLGASVALSCAVAGPTGAQSPDVVTPTPTSQVTPAATAVVSPTVSPSLMPNPLAEQWVTEQLDAGRIADLSKRFPAESERVLSGTFLQNLLTRPLTGSVASRHGVRIVAAVISDTIDLRNAEVPFEVWLNGCRFGSAVDLSLSHWASALDLSGSLFKANVSLSDARIEHSLGLVRTQFEGAADLSYLTIGRDLVGNNVQFLDTRLGAALSHVQIGGAVYLRSALLAGPAYLTGARIDGDFWADQSRFTYVKGGASFTSLTVGGSLSLVGAELSGPADFFNAQVGGNFVASESKFTDTAVGASFSSMRVGGYAFFRQATFAGRADFGRMEVGLDFEVTDVQFTHPEQEATFNTMKVGGYASISRTTFAGPVGFVYATVALDLYADSVRFTNPTQGSNFSEMKVGGHVAFTDASFAGPVLFNRMSVGADFVAYNARFSNPQETVGFSSMRVGGFASFSRAEFDGSADFGLSPMLGIQADGLQFTNPQGKASFSDLNTPSYVFMVNGVFTSPVEFIGSDIGGDLMLNGTRFANEEKAVTFVSAKVGGNLFMHGAAFAGTMDLSHATVGLNLELDGAQFSSRQPANFGNFKVGGIASFPNTVFSGPVNFAGGEVLGQFVFDGAQFDYPEDISVAFNGMTVGDSVLMQGVTASATVAMADATFLDLTVTGEGDSPPPLPRLDMSRLTVRRELYLENLRLTQGWVAPSLQVLGPCVLSNVTIQGQAALPRASLQSLLLSHVTWPTDTQQVRLDGVTYQNISAGTDHPTSWLTLLNWVNHAAYSASAYTTLEQYYRQRGYPEEADTVFVAGRRRERAEALGGPASASWWWSLILDAFVVYGRRPGRAFIWSGLIIAFGMLVFRRRYMEPLKPEFAEHGYSALWYSLDLFVPVLDLLTATRWTPRRKYWLMRDYLRIHAILGWLLIPIGLAALSGILK